ncbi:hypothetical protein DFH09DRAFT_1326835 [Mycena vulgaris]|nr:hypothetical protein DFH09DRAFT_1326835 [Mycena vulgaris]
MSLFCFLVPASCSLQPFALVRSYSTTPPAQPPAAMATLAEYTVEKPSRGRPSAVTRTSAERTLTRSAKALFYNYQYLTGTLAVFPLERHTLYGRAYLFLSVCSSFILTPCSVPRVNRDPSGPRVRLPLPNALRLSRGRRVASLVCPAAASPPPSVVPPLSSPHALPALDPRPCLPASLPRQSGIASTPAPFKLQRSSLRTLSVGRRASSRVSSLRRPHCAYSASATPSASASASAAAAAASAFQPSASDRGKVPASARPWFFENESTSDSSVDAERAALAERGRYRMRPASTASTTRPPTRAARPHRPPATPFFAPAVSRAIVTRDAGMQHTAKAKPSVPAPPSIPWRAAMRHGPAHILVPHLVDAKNYRIGFGAPSADRMGAVCVCDTARRAFGDGGMEGRAVTSNQSY